MRSYGLPERAARSRKARTEERHGARLIQEHLKHFSQSTFRKMPLALLAERMASFVRRAMAGRPGATLRQKKTLRFAASIASARAFVTVSAIRVHSFRLTSRKTKMKGVHQMMTLMMTTMTIRIRHLEKKPSTSSSPIPFSPTPRSPGR